jgi:hypothetical protein
MAVSIPVSPWFLRSEASGQAGRQGTISPNQACPDIRRIWNTEIADAAT